MRLEAFLGNWTIVRRIEDRIGGRPGLLDGVSRFSPAPDGLAYAEEGWLRFGDAAPAFATRRYRWTDVGGGMIEVRFEDGRLFHRFLAEEPEPTAEHNCPPDLYRVRYDFRRWPRWSAEWRVRGPRKDYAMTTEYSRAGT